MSTAISNNSFLKIHMFRRSISLNSRCSEGWGVAAPSCPTCGLLIHLCGCKSWGIAAISTLSLRISCLHDFCFHLCSTFIFVITENIKKSPILYHLKEILQHYPGTCHHLENWEVLKNTAPKVVFKEGKKQYKTTEALNGAAKLCPSL